MAKFWELFQESVILQSIITVILIGGVVYMYATGKEVPNDLMQMALLVLGFYFGAKVENRKVKSAIANMVEKESAKKME